MPLTSCGPRAVRCERGNLALVRLGIDPPGRAGLAAQGVGAGREAVPLAGREAVPRCLAGVDEEAPAELVNSREHGSLRGGGELRVGFS